MAGMDLPSYLGTKQEITEEVIEATAESK
jgi:hypothetical protein